MGVRLLTQDGKTAIYDSVTDTAFGPVFYGLDADEDADSEGADSEEMAQLFLDWLAADARVYSNEELRGRFGDFLSLVETVGFKTLLEEVPE